MKNVDSRRSGITSSASGCSDFVTNVVLVLAVVLALLLHFHSNLALDAVWAQPGTAAVSTETSLQISPVFAPNLARNVRLDSIYSITHHTSSRPFGPVYCVTLKLY